MSPGADGASVLVTGGLGYVGKKVVAALASHSRAEGPVVSLDIRPPTPEERVPGVRYETADIGAPSLADLLARHRTKAVVHLAAVLSPKKGQSREELFALEVGGARNLLAACASAGVKKLVFTSSGAAYGYHADNSPLLSEEDPLRGNEAFPYAWLKRLVEDELQSFASEHPEVEQLVFRVCTVVGEHTRGPVTAMFERRVVVGVKGAATPFCFIWDEDLVACIAEGVFGAQTGVYNVSGEGALTLREIAAALGRRYLALPPDRLRRILGLLRRFGLSPHGPEQVVFLEHRPVLGNARLKRDFEGLPTKSSREAFEIYRAARV